MSDRDMDPYPLGGHTDFDGDDVLVEMLAGSAVMVPASAKRLSADGKRAVADALRLAAEINRLQAELADQVAYLRETGVSWGVIGWSCGMTGQGASKRWS